MKNLLKLISSAFLIITLIFTCSCAKEKTPRERFTEASAQIFENAEIQEPQISQESPFRYNLNAELKGLSELLFLEDDSTIKLSANGIYNSSTDGTVNMTLDILGDSIYAEYLTTNGQYFISFPEVYEKYIDISSYYNDTSYINEEVNVNYTTVTQLCEKISEEISAVLTDDDFTLAKENAVLDDKIIEKTDKITLTLSDEKIKTILSKVYDLYLESELNTETISSEDAALAKEDLLASIPEGAFTNISFYQAEDKTAAWKIDIFDGSYNYSYIHFLEENIGKFSSDNEALPTIYYSSNDTTEGFEHKLEIKLNVSDDEEALFMPENIAFTISGNTVANGEEKQITGNVTMSMAISSMTISQSIPYDIIYSPNRFYIDVTLDAGAFLISDMGFTLDMTMTPAQAPTQINIPTETIDFENEEEMTKFYQAFYDKHSALVDYFAYNDEDDDLLSEDPDLSNLEE